MDLNSTAWYANHGFSEDEGSDLDLNAGGWTLDDPHDLLEDGYNDGLVFHPDDGFGNYYNNGFDGHNHPRFEGIDHGR